METLHIFKGRLRISLLFLLSLTLLLANQAQAAPLGAPGLEISKAVEAGLTSVPSGQPLTPLTGQAFLYTGMQRVDASPDSRLPLAWAGAIMLAILGLAIVVRGLQAGALGSPKGIERILEGVVVMLVAVIMILALLLSASGSAVALEQDPSAQQLPALQAPDEGGGPSDVAAEGSFPIFATPTPPPVSRSEDGGRRSPPDTSSVVRIEIPDIGVDAVVRFVPFNGWTWDVAGLQEDVAWLGETSWPGLGGNTVLAAHVRLSGGVSGPFERLFELEPGARVIVYTEQNRYVYVISGQRVVAPEEVSVTYATLDPQLTLLTCTGWDASSSTYLERRVISADLLEVLPLQADS